jgi:urease accessory protein UreF
MNLKDILQTFNKVANQAAESPSMKACEKACYESRVAFGAVYDAWQISGPLPAAQVRAFEKDLNRAIKACKRLLKTVGSQSQERLAHFRENIEIRRRLLQILDDDGPDAVLETIWSDLPNLVLPGETAPIELAATD